MSVVFKGSVSFCLSRDILILFLRLLIRRHFFMFLLCVTTSICEEFMLAGWLIYYASWYPRYGFPSTESAGFQAQIWKKLTRDLSTEMDRTARSIYSTTLANLLNCPHNYQSI